MEDDKDIKWEHLLKVLDNYGKYLVQLIRDNLARNGSNASYTLSDGLDYEVGVDGLHYYVDLNLEDYWYYVENGRKAGKMPPIDKIRQWVIDKPITPRPYTPSIDSLAFVIQRSIREKKGYAPPREALKKWMNRKGVTPKPQLPSVDQLAFLIARKIGSEGTQGKPFLQEAIDAANAYYRESIDYAIAEDYEDWIENVVDETLSNLHI